MNLYDDDEYRDIEDWSPRRLVHSISSKKWLCKGARRRASKWAKRTGHRAYRRMTKSLVQGARPKLVTVSGRDVT